MADSYFIKRGEKVSGPFSAGQLKKLAKDGKFRDDDGVSNRQDGPWTPAAKAFKKQQEASHQQSVTPETETPATKPSETVQAPEEAEQIAEEVLGITPESETPATEPSDAPRTRQCEDCGGVVSKRARVCPHCGAPIVSDAEEKQPSPTVDASSAPMPVNVVTNYGTVVLSRKKKLDGSWSKIWVCCDRLEVATLKNGESVNLQLAGGIHTFTARMPGDNTVSDAEPKQFNIVSAKKTTICVYVTGTWKKRLTWA